MSEIDRLNGISSLGRLHPERSPTWSRKSLNQFTLTSAGQGSSQFSVDQKLWDLQTLQCSQADGHEMVLHYGLVCISLINNEVRHLFIRLLTFLASYSGIYLFIFFYSFFHWAFGKYWFMSYLYILDLSPLPILCIANIFPACSLSFHLFNYVFGYWGIFYFNNINFIRVFLYGLCFLYFIKSLLQQKIMRHSLTFYSKNCFSLLGSWIPLRFLYLVWAKVSILFYFFLENNKVLITFWKSVLSPLTCNATLLHISNVHLQVCSWALRPVLAVQVSIPVLVPHPFIAMCCDKLCCMLGWNYHPLLLHVCLTYSCTYSGIFFNQLVEFPKKHVKILIGIATKSIYILTGDWHLYHIKFSVHIHNVFFSLFRSSLRVVYHFCNFLYKGFKYLLLDLLWGTL